jgi:ABC-type ATPase involved in cell division
MPSSTLISTTHSAATSADEEKKDDSQTIQELLKKIYKLDDAQRRQLFQILKEMESKGQSLLLLTHSSCLGSRHNQLSSARNKLRSKEAPNR